MATVTGTIRNPDTTAYVGRVRFTSLSTPLVDSAKVVAGVTAFANTDASGNFSITLQLGNYRVEAAKQTWEIGVPSGSSSYSLLSIVTGGMNNFLIPAPGSGGSGTPATSTELGLVLTTEDVGTPVVPVINGDEVRLPDKVLWLYGQKLFNPTTGKYYTIQLRGDEGSVAFSIGQIGEDAP